MSLIKFENILKAINYEMNNEIKDAIIMNPIFDEGTYKLTFTVSFPNVISPNALIDLNWALLEGLKVKRIAKEVEINYKFIEKEISGGLLKDYYNTVLDAIIEKQIRYKALKKFKTSYDDKKVILYLGDREEIRFVKPLLDNIYKSFCTLGLEFVSLDVEVSSFIPSITDEIEVSREVSINESITKQNMYEVIKKN